MKTKVNGNAQAGIFRNINFVAKNIAKAPSAIANTVRDIYQPGEASDLAFEKMKALRQMAAQGTQGWKSSGSLQATQQSKQSNRANETKTLAKKAAYLFKFANLCEWPREKGEGNFNMAVIDDPGIENALKRLEGKPIRGQRLQIVRVKKPEDLKNLNVKILYLNPSSPEFPKFYDCFHKGDRDLHTLCATTSDTKLVPVGRGQAFSFTEKKGRLKFAVNVDSVRRRSVKIDFRFVKSTSVLVTDRGKKTAAP